MQNTHFSLPNSQCRKVSDRMGTGMTLLICKAVYLTFKELLCDFLLCSHALLPFCKNNFIFFKYKLIMMNKNNSVSAVFPATPIPMPKDEKEQISNN